VAAGAESTGCGAGTPGSTVATTGSAGLGSFAGGAAFLAAFFTGFGAAGEGPSASGVSALDAAAFFAAFLTGFGSSGCSGRVNPSRSARRRSRSACASMSVEE
jgi:hypothetical protein